MPQWFPPYFANKLQSVLGDGSKVLRRIYPGKWCVIASPTVARTMALHHWHEFINRLEEKRQKYLPASPRSSYVLNRVHGSKPRLTARAATLPNPVSPILLWPCRSHDTPSLVKDAVDGVAKELHHRFGGSTQGDLGGRSSVSFKKYKLNERKKTQCPEVLCCFLYFHL